MPDSSHGDLSETVGFYFLSDWEPGQPSVGTSQQCVAVSTVHTQWEDKSCSDNYDTVCQIHM